MNFFSVFLGILTAAGGFIDISNLVYNTQSGAQFGYNLLWATLISTIVIAIFSEMSGRIAAVARLSVFDIIREKLGFSIALVILLLGNLVSILTCIAEIGGVAIILRLFSGYGYLQMTLVAFLLLVGVVWFSHFKFIENLFGMMGLFMTTFVVSALFLHINWNQFFLGFVPIIPPLHTSSSYIRYAYFVVGVISSVLMPYEVYFYSSGGIEDHWTEKDVNTNRLTSYLGYGVGSLFAIALTTLGTVLFFSKGIHPQLLGSVLLGPATAFGKIGILLALLGMLFAIGGAAIETCFSGAYSLAQFFGWRWGRYLDQSQAPLFTISWIVIFTIAFLIALTNVDPVQITQYAVIFSVVPLPFTYIPIFLIANDALYMKHHTNGKIMNVLGIASLVIIVIIALTAIPLLILSGGGNG